MSQQASRTTQPAKAAGEIYGENAVWLCRNLATGFKTRINGALAEVLRQYPDDYQLRLLKTREAS